MKNFQQLGEFIDRSKMSVKECPNCGRLIRIEHLVPVVSDLAAHYECPYCGRRLN